MLKNPSEIFNNKEDVSDTETSNLFEKFKVSTEIVESYDKFRGNIEKVNNLFDEVQNLSKELSEKLSKQDLENAIFSQLVLLDENYKTVQRYKKQLTKNEIVFCEKIDKIKKDVGNNFNFIENISEELRQLSNLIVEDYRTEVDDIKSSVVINEHHIKTIDRYLKEHHRELVEDYRTEVDDIKSSVVINEHHIKTIDRYLKEHHRELVEVKESVFDEIGKVSADGKISAENFLDNFKRLENKIDFIKETYSKIKPEDIVKEVISESIISEPSNTNNSDKLTPLDQNYVTLDQLEQHYRLFVNRIQQQLSTFGGGGETRLKYLDDIVGIATNPGIYDGKYLKYNHSLGKFEFDIADDTDDSWIEGSGGPYTIGSVGIGTTLVSTSSTKLEVHGDVRIVGILTVGSSSVTIDGTTNTISVGNDVQLRSSGLSGTASNATNLDNQLASYYLDYTNFTNTPTDLDSFINNVGYATETFVNEAIANIVSSAPATLDTLNELAQALGDDDNFSTTVTNLIGTKASLSGATFTGIVTGTLEGTASNATNLDNQLASYYLNYDNFSNVPTVLSSFTNDVGYATETFVNNLVSISTFSGNYNDLSNTPTALSSFTNDVGFVTSSIVVGYATEGFVNNLVSISTFSGNYNDLSNTPTALSSFTNDVGYATEGFVNNLVSISTFSGNYNDLSNTPTALSSFTNDVGFVTSSIVVGYATEGFVNNLVSISTFSGNYNDLSNTPTALSSFTNDVGFVTSLPSLVTITT